MSRRAGGVVNLCRLAMGGALFGAAQEPTPRESDLALVRSAESRRVEVLAQAARATVCIFADREFSGGGSGVLIDPEGLGLTNFHVIADFLESGGYGGLSDGKLYPLRVLGVDVGGDVAMFQLEGAETFPVAQLGNSDAVRVGQWVAAIGNPFLLAEDFRPTITLGVVTGVHRYQAGQNNALEYADCLQVSTSINPGNSGGPLFDMNGRVLGINGRAAFEERGRVNVGLGFAISMKQIERFIPSLRAGLTPLHGTLGATVQRAGEDLIFDAIQELAPAEKAGVQLGDLLEAVNGRPVRTPNEFNNAIAVLPANWPVRLTVRREGKSVELGATLEPLPVAIGAPIIPKLEDSQAEVRRLWARARARMGLLKQPQSAAHATVRIQNGQGDAARSVRVELRVEPGALTLHTSEAELVIRSAGETPPAEQPGLAWWAESRVWNEWLAIATALLAPEPPAGEWAAIGGHEIDGRIVAEIERRMSESSSVRWSFDEQSGVLTRVAWNGAEAGDFVTWNLRERGERASMPLPQSWERIAASGRWVVEIESMQVQGESPADSSATSSAPIRENP